MTIAVCFKCGSIKYGAFNCCDKCSNTPSNEDELVYSLAMTDHYFDKSVLEQMGASIAAGDPPELNPETRIHLIDSLRSSGLYNNVIKSKYVDNNPPIKPKKPWWKKLVL